MNIKLNKKLLYLFFFLPLFLEGFYIYTFGVNVPLSDEIDFYKFVPPWYEGTLTFHDLYAPWNSHRLSSCKAILLLTGTLTHFSCTVNMFLSLIFQTLTLALLFSVYRRQFGDSTRALWFFLPLPWLWFNWAQYNNLLCGLQFTIHGTLLGFTLTIYLLDKSRKVDGLFITGLLTALFTTYSILSGLLIWPLGFLFLFLTRKNRERSSLIYWAGASCFICIAYFYNWNPGAHNASTSTTLANPGFFIKTFLLNQGILLSPDEIMGTWMGILGGLILLLSLLSTLPLSFRHAFWRKNAFWLMITFFGIGTGLMISVSVLGKGFSSTISRYTTYTLMGMTGIYLLLLSRLNSSSSNKPLYKIIFVIYLSAMVLGLGVSYKYGYDQGKIWRIKRKVGESILKHPQWAPPYLYPLCLYSSYNLISQRTPLMKKYGINVFQAYSEWKDLSPLSDKGQIRVERVNGKLLPPSGESAVSRNKIQPLRFFEWSLDQEKFLPEEKRYLEISGWAIDHQNKRPPRDVYLRIDGQVLIPAVCGWERRDISAQLQNSSYQFCGFRAFIPLYYLPKGKRSLELFVVESHGKGYFPSPTKLFLKME